MIIDSLLDNDFYKITMQQFVLHQFPKVKVEYKFKCRTPGIEFDKYINEIIEEIEYLCSLKFTVDELTYLNTLRNVKYDYVKKLQNFQLNKKFISIKNNYGDLDITIKGSWFQTILFEVPVLAIIHEVYSNKNAKRKTYLVGQKFLMNKINKINDYNSSIFKPSFNFADFGTRRRFNYDWQDIVINDLKHNCKSGFIGTSNVYLAKRHSINPIGTMAHEIFQAGQVLARSISSSQPLMLQKWADEYRGALGIALTDTLGIDKFLRDFDMYFAKLYDGVRHDSGDPIAWGEKIIQHYMKLGIDPRTKKAVFSDNLDINKAMQILKRFGRDIQVSFGIGTNLTNDLGYKALQIVIKMVKCNGKDVVKISDDPGKTMTKNKKYLRRVMKEITSITTC